MSDESDIAEDEIIRSWHVNAEPWTEAVRSQSIASRKLVTDKAIVDAVRSVDPRRVLDIGCGEGWLARALRGLGVNVFGIDVVPALIAEAKRHGGGDFEIHSYRDFASRRANFGSFDAAVCNFSLLGRESVESLLGTVGMCLNAPGYLIVQTLHPVAACGSQPYEDGWRAGSWSGFSPDFTDPAPWFFRTLASWYAMLRRCGFDVVECREPTVRGATIPSSIIYICSQRSTAALV
ncbi:MAG TPA: class I SAM-dependent methyltransferase [Steroidobacteraceae bacterium]|nr:class I SAM-dependent methyltransferase [Steroidobacteraceae bacterium]